MKPPHNRMAVATNKKVEPHILTRESVRDMFLRQASAEQYR